MNNFFNRHKVIAIGIDPGFDGTKIIINGKAITQPTFYVETTGDVNKVEKLFGDDKTKITYTFIDKKLNKQREFLLGADAHDMLKYNHDQKVRTEVDEFKKLDRFTTESFGAVLNGYLLYAIAKYAEDNEDGFALENINEWDIFVGIGLPHSEVDKTWSQVQIFLTDSPEGTIHYEQTKSFTAKLNIKPENTLSDSQVLAAFKGMGFDDTGRVDLSLVTDLKEMLPAIVNDGGYVTEGISLITESFNVMNDISNTEFAMRMNDIEVSNRINKMISQNNGTGMISDVDIANILKSGYQYETVDKASVFKITKEEVSEMRKNCIAENAAKLVSFLKENYPMPQVHSILNIGGTGAAYQEHLEKAFKTYNEELKVKAIDPEICGTKPGKIYTVAIGVYKHVMNDLRSKFKDDED